MKKHLTSLLFVLFCLSATFGQQNKRLLCHIPADVFLVLNANHENLLSKVAIERIKTLPMIQEGLANLKMRARKDSNMVITMWEDPNHYGINIAQGASGFFQLGESRFGRPLTSGGLFIPLSSRGKFQNFLKEVTKEGYPELVEKGRGYKFIANRSATIAWTRKYILIMGGDMSEEELVEDMHRMIKLKKSESLLSNEEFVEQASHNIDYFQWINMEAYSQKTESDLGIMALALGSGVTGIMKDFVSAIYRSSSSVGIEFNDGTLDLKTQRSTYGQLKEVATQLLKPSINPKLLDFVTEEEIMGAIAVSVDVDFLHSFAQEHLNDDYDSLYLQAKKAMARERADTNALVLELMDEYYAADTLDWEVQNAMYDSIQVIEDSIAEALLPTMDDFIDSTLSVFGFERPDVWNVFTGDLLVACTGTFGRIDTFQTYDYVENDDGEFVYAEVEKTEVVNSPLFKAVFSTGTPDQLNYFLTKLDSIGLVQKKGHYFQNVVGKYDMFATVSPESFLIVSNDSSFVQNLPVNGWKTSEPARGTSYSLSQENSYFLYADGQKIFDSLDLKEDDQLYMDIVQKYLNTFTNHASVDPNSGVLNSQVNITFSNPKDNSLIQLFEMINGYYELFNRAR